MNTNPGSESDTPPGGLDPGATRYFPSQEASGQAGSAATQAPPPQPEQYTPAYRPNGGQQGAVLPSYSPYGGAHRDRDRTVLALILIGGGLLFLLDQLRLFGGFGNLVLLLIGGIFMYAYFSTKPGYRIGFLIPGAILIGLGVGEVLKSLPFPNLIAGGDISALTLGLGFCLIWFFERKHWWALIPGGILILSSISSMWIIGNLWPLVLIGLGVYLLYDQSRRRAG
jgi:hypothetical protein